MGKGDRKTKRGKRWAGSYGKHRMRQEKKAKPEQKKPGSR
jgi:ribosomal small subunit protein bTHX